jgi:hypothetical protein
MCNEAPHHKDVWVSGGKAPILTSAIDGGEWSASPPRQLYSWGMSPRYPLDRRLGGPQSRSERYGEEKNLFPLLGIEHRPSYSGSVLPKA